VWTDFTDLNPVYVNISEIMSLEEQNFPSWEIIQTK